VHLIQAFFLSKLWGAPQKLEDTILPTNKSLDLWPESETEREYESSALLEIEILGSVSVRRFGARGLRL